MPLDLRSCPELAITGPNPFLEVIHPFIPYPEWASNLDSFPLEATGSWKELPPAYREPLLDCYDQHFVTSQDLFQIAADVQRILRHALVLSNPLKVENLQRTNRVLLSGDRLAMLRLSGLDGAGGIIAAITGSGKTRLICMLLRVLVPKPVVDYGKSDVCGWTKLVQLVYLHLDHATNGTRGGLLHRILEAMDAELGTSYSEENKRTANIDVLLVVVVKKLVLHRVAILVVDEKQEKTFADSAWQIEFALLYLSLMNLGISVLLAGNPLAFENLMIFSQVRRRFAWGGIHHMKPAPTASTRWWSKDFVPGMRKFSLVDSYAVPAEQYEKWLFDGSGGVRGLCAVLHVEAQRHAIRNLTGSVAELSEIDMKAALASPRFKELQSIANAIRTPDQLSSFGFLDLPGPNVSVAGSSSRSAGPSNARTEAISMLQQVHRRMQAETTRASSKFKRLLDAIHTFSPDDSRMLGVSKEMIEEAERFRRNLENEAAAKAGPKATRPASGKDRSNGAT